MLKRRDSSITALVILLLALVAGEAWATGPWSPSPCRCLALREAKLDGKVVLEGRAQGVNFPGRGLILETCKGKRIIYGLGPRWYWKMKGITRPLAGKKIRVQAFRVKTPRGSYLVAYNIKLKDREIQLRDPRTGLPLWGRWYRARGQRSPWSKARTCYR